MKRNYFFEYKILLLLLLLMASGCDKDSRADKDEIIATEQYYNSFSKISFQDIFEVVLKTDSIFKVILITNENYIDKISFSLDSGNLTFTDNNPEKWLPKYPWPVVKISMPKLEDQIFLTSPVRITTSDTLKLPKLRILTQGKAGETDILMDTENFSFITGSDNSGYYRFSGNAVNSRIWHRGSSIVDAGNLHSISSSVYNNSIGDCKIHAERSLEVRIDRTGNIYYYGNPEILIIEDTGKGGLINLLK